MYHPLSHCLGLRCVVGLRYVTRFWRLVPLLLGLAITCSSSVRAADRELGPPITVTGELRIIYADDFANRRAELMHFIEDKKNNKRYRLHMDRQPPAHWRTDMTVTVRGQAKGRELYLEADGVGSEEVLAPTSAEMSGEQQTIVMLGNFADVPLTCSVQAVRDAMFTDPNNQSIDDLYQEMSLGQIWFTGQVRGTYQIGYKSTDPCDVNAWADAIESAATADDVDLAAYSRRVYVLPSDNTCGWSGLASVGGNPSRAWIMRCDNRSLYGHELGHNLGMNHASTLTSEYGDTSDIMGSPLSPLRQINGPHQEQMGWRAPIQITNVAQSGTYDVAPIELSETQALAPQVLKVAKPDTGEHYYVSYRQPIGFDASLPAGLTSRLHIHRYQGNGGRTWFLRGLFDGETFVDDANNITITHIQHNPGYATAQITLNASCVIAAPAVEMTPPTQSAGAGTTLAYDISLTNGDSAACAESTFALDSVLPANWAGTVSPGTLTLVPGQSGQATLSVTSPQNITADSYSVGVDVSDSSETNHSNSANATYVVAQACVAAAPSVTLAPNTQSGIPGDTLAYTVSVTNADGNTCAASTFALSYSVPNDWTGAVSPANMALDPGATGHATLLVTSASSAAPGLFAVAVNVDDTTVPAHSASDSASYEVLTVADTQPPTPPTGLTASVKRKQVNLSWGASTDNVGVSVYKVWRNAVLIGSAAETTYVDRSVNAGSSYTYFVVAVDETGNTSEWSNLAAVTVSGGGKGGGSGKGGGKKR